MVYLVGSYAGHTPFTEQDIDIFLNQYGANPEKGRQIKEEFLQEAGEYIYPRMASDHPFDWASYRIFEPLAFMSYLLRQLVKEAQNRPIKPIIAGVVERGNLREFSERVLLDRVFRGLQAKARLDYFNQMYGRSDLRSPRTMLDRLGYTDTLLLAMLLQPGEYSEPWLVDKYESLRDGWVSLPNKADSERVHFAALKPGGLGFPRICGSYVSVSETTEPVRIEVFEALGEEQVPEAARRVYLYARLLPGYGFPVGLDIADKYSHVPAWLTDAYSKLIRHHLGISLQQGEISDTEMRRILVQAIYMTHRDWLFRPKD